MSHAAPRNSCVIEAGKSNCQLSEMTRAEIETLIAQKEALGKPIHAEMTALHMRYSLPLATFFTTLLVAPLAVGIGRFGSAVCTAVSLGLVFGWQMIYAVAYPMGNIGALPPFWAAWVQNILFAALGFCLWLFLNRHDFSNPFSGIFSSIRSSP